jgi:hypothetical protein
LFREDRYFAAISKFSDDSVFLLISSFMMKTIDNSLCLGLLLLAGLPVWAQDDKPPVVAPAASGALISGLANLSSANGDDRDDRMQAPPPVSGTNYPVSYTSGEQSNYLRGGVTFNTAYSDNVLGTTSATPVSDISYSVWPTIALDESTSRLHAVVTYAPGFTFYQRTSSRNEQDQNVALAVQYRLSPHVTVSLQDALQKSSSVFNQPDQGLGIAVSGSTQAANDSVIAPLADRLSNNGNAGINYQFGANSMVGASGTFTNLHYPNPTEVPGLFDAASRAGLAYYSFRFSPQHYLGVTYQYQELLSYPTQGTNQTETDGFFVFYTFYAGPAFSFSLFGGPQYWSAGVQYLSATQTIAAQQAWTPAAGGSLNWQARHSGAALSYSHTVSGGGGLVGAVKLDSASLSLRQQLTRNLSASLAGGYANNGVLAVSSLGGHSFSGSAGLQRQVGEHLNLQAGYTRLHQDYSFSSLNPDTNREWVSVSYQFARPLGK